MARIRTIKPEFFRHEELFELERETGLPIRVAFAGLWTAADREGRFEWRPRQLKLDCLPYDDVDFSRVLHALTTRGFVQKYTVEGVEYGCIPSWSRHQNINNRESQSTIPAPDETLEESDSSTREPRVSHASSTRQGNYQGEGEGEGERNISPHTHRARVGAYAMTLDWRPDQNAWDLYAKRAGITDADLTNERLTEFTGYWHAEQSIQTESQWVHKLVSHIKRLRTQGGNHVKPTGTGNAGRSLSAPERVAAAIAERDARSPAGGRTFEHGSAG